MPLFESFDLWSIGGFAVGIVGIILAIVFYFRGKNRKILEYEMHSTNLITEDMANIPGISISLNGQPVSNLISTTIRFINTGNQTILSDDFATLEPLGILAERQFFNTNQGISVYSDNPNSIPHIKTMNTNGNNQYIEVEFIKPKESISITLLHDGPLTISGDLKSGKKVQERSHTSKPTLIYSIIAASATLLGVLLSSLSIKIQSVPLVRVSQCLFTLSFVLCLYSLMQEFKEK